MKHRPPPRSIHPDGPTPAAEIVINLVLEIERVRQKVHPGPMLTCLVVDEITGLPDERWFKLAQELGHMQPGEDPKGFWIKQLDACRAPEFVHDCGITDCPACRVMRKEDK